MTQLYPSYVNFTQWHLLDIKYVNLLYKDFSLIVNKWMNHKQIIYKTVKDTQNEILNIYNKNHLPNIIL